jgi:GH24 family phage-related lysozyme (muramidase)
VHFGNEQTEKPWYLHSFWNTTSLCVIYPLFWDGATYSHSKQLRDTSGSLSLAGHTLRQYAALVQSVCLRDNISYHSGTGKKSDIGVAGTKTQQQASSTMGNSRNHSMKSLRKGDRGPEVRQLQEKLVAAGFPLSPDAYFWNTTDTALRAFQRKKGLIPDGIAGAKTIDALAVTGTPKTTSTSPSILNSLLAMLGGPVVQAAVLARYFMPVGQSSRPASQLHISSKGSLFIYTLEAQKNVSNFLHWPGGASGVTLGPGYDMKERTQAAITADMVAVGVDLAIARKIAEGAGLVSATAKEFVKVNHSLVKLTSAQELQLLGHIVPKYEKIISDALTVDLLQHEFDALVSFAYNPGGRFGTVARLINQGKVADAMQTIKLANKSGGAVMQGLVKRREHEVALYLFNNYGKLRTL